MKQTALFLTVFLAGSYAWAQTERQDQISTIQHNISAAGTETLLARQGRPNVSVSLGGLTWTGSFLFEQADDAAGTAREPLVMTQVYPPGPDTSTATADGTWTATPTRAVIIVTPTALTAGTPTAAINAWASAPVTTDATVLYQSLGCPLSQSDPDCAFTLEDKQQVSVTLTGSGGFSFQGAQSLTGIRESVSLSTGGADPVSSGTVGGTYIGWAGLPYLWVVPTEAATSHVVDLTSTAVPVTPAASITATVEAPASASLNPCANPQTYASSINFGNADYTAGLSSVGSGLTLPAGETFYACTVTVSADSTNFQFSILSSGLKIPLTVVRPNESVTRGVPGEVLFSGGAPSLRIRGGLASQSAQNGPHLGTIMVTYGTSSDWP